MTTPLYSTYNMRTDLGLNNSTVDSASNKTHSPYSCDRTQGKKHMNGFRFDAKSRSMMEF